MADYNLDGNYFRHRNGNTVAELQGNHILDWASSSFVGEIEGMRIKDSRGNYLAEFDGNDIRDRSGNRIGDMNDVHNSIEGHGGVSLVAFWILYVR